MFKPSAPRSASRIKWRSMGSSQTLWGRLCCNCSCDCCYGSSCVCSCCSCGCWALWTLDSTKLLLQMPSRPPPPPPAAAGLSSTCSPAFSSRGCVVGVAPRAVAAPGRCCCTWASCLARACAKASSVKTLLQSLHRNLLHIPFVSIVWLGDRLETVRWKHAAAFHEHGTSNMEHGKREFQSWKIAEKPWTSGGRRCFHWTFHITDPIFVAIEALHRWLGFVG